jgi:hypothetical protein
LVEIYRILEAPDGEHWIDSPKNNRRDPSLAVIEAKEAVFFNPFSRVKVINAKTKTVIFETKGARVI